MRAYRDLRHRQGNHLDEFQYLTLQRFHSVCGRRICSATTSAQSDRELPITSSRPERIRPTPPQAPAQNCPPHRAPRSRNAPARICRQRLPLIGRKRAVSADKPHWHQESPRRIQLCAPAQVGHRKPDNHASRDVHDQRAVGEANPHPPRDRRAHPIARNRPQRAANGNQQILLQSVPLRKDAASSAESVARNLGAPSVAAPLLSWVGKHNSTAATSCVSYSKFAGIVPDVTHRQDRLSGVIICPALQEGQRLTAKHHCQAARRTPSPLPLHLLHGRLQFACQVTSVAYVNLVCSDSGSCLIHDSSFAVMGGKARTSPAQPSCPRQMVEATLSPDTKYRDQEADHRRRQRRYSQAMHCVPPAVLLQRWLDGRIRINTRQPVVDRHQKENRQHDHRGPDRAGGNQQQAARSRHA